MISVLIATYNEPRTIGKQIEAFLKEHYDESFEILICASDQATFHEAKKYTNNKRVKVYRDQKRGKPHALNLLLKKAKGSILILSDGDVQIQVGAVTELLKQLSDKNVGAVTGRPVSISPRETMLGYWSHLLTDRGAHTTRLRLAKRGKFIQCSGYLFAMRNVVKKIPTAVLSDDAYISQIIAQQGYKIAYAPKARVLVKYPSSYHDWLIQKIRSGGGIHQLQYYFKKQQHMRTMTREAFWGLLTAFSYPQSFKEVWFTLSLFGARLHLWYKIKKVISKDIDFHAVWKEVPSTK